ncbi:MAG: polysaccharide deacetylase family protein [Candidatus Krumholzibacteriota bacterium]|nr:polysaccharide deacetylase family protein [Candidatus Krumholzibacteriota bacterium]
MATRIFITIDTEEDSWDRRSRTDNAVSNISYIPKIQDLFDEFGAVPTYLLDYPVVVDPAASEIILKIHEEGRCEIGTHCHPWNTPPFEEEMTDHNSMLCNLPYSLICKKLEILHKAIIDRFDTAPICFRAGRWGFGPDVARSIMELGYHVDSSVLPLWDWTDYCGPDFSGAPSSIYHFSPENILEEKPGNGLVEVPVTMSFMQKPFARYASLRRRLMRQGLSRFHLLGVLDKLKILNLRMLSPEVSTSFDMIRTARNYLEDGNSFLNMTFHSTSLMPGKSEFVRDENDLRDFIAKIRAFLEFCSDEKFSFSPLSDVLENSDG